MSLHSMLPVIVIAGALVVGWFLFVIICKLEEKSEKQDSKEAMATNVSQLDLAEGSQPSPAPEGYKPCELRKVRP